MCSNSRKAFQYNLNAAGNKIAGKDIYADYFDCFTGLLIVSTITPTRFTLICIVISSLKTQNTNMYISFCIVLLTSFLDESLVSASLRTSPSQKASWISLSQRKIVSVVGNIVYGL